MGSPIFLPHFFPFNRSSIESARMRKLTSLELMVPVMIFWNLQESTHSSSCPLRFLITFKPLVNCKFLSSCDTILILFLLYGVAECQQATLIGFIRPKNKFPFESMASAALWVPREPISCNTKECFSLHNFIYFSFYCYSQQMPLVVLHYRPPISWNYLIILLRQHFPSLLPMSGSIVVCLYFEELKNKNIQVTVVLWYLLQEPYLGPLYFRGSMYQIF